MLKYEQIPADLFKYFEQEKECRVDVRKNIHPT